jgi:VacB/RNase II family 3'-5' exoribonuclease
MTNAQLAPGDLKEIAHGLMIDAGFSPDFSPEALAQAAAASGPPANGTEVQDLTSLPWTSIDNDTSKDLDQIEVAEPVAGAAGRVRIAIADVDSLVPIGSPVDVHAARETTTVYAGVINFPMLPVALSNGSSSLNEDGTRLAVVTEFVVSTDGALSGGKVYRARVKNAAKLTYREVGAWLEGHGPAPSRVAASSALQTQLQLQDAIARALRTDRSRHGALDLETSEAHAPLPGEPTAEIDHQERNRATDLIEDFMIAANETVALLLEQAGSSSIRRVVKTPARWPRIVELAAQYGARLPADPDPKPLNEFLLARRAADPEAFADLSLAIIKLLGPGEYVVRQPGSAPQGHFGLAVENYTHSTAPNRRFADLAAQRLVKSIIAKSPAAYTPADLDTIARRCTLMEDAARKVERGMAKRLAASSMTSRIGQVFDAVVTGATAKGTFVRVLPPRVEGLLARGANGADVGDRLKVRLIHTDPARGFIDFARV